MEGLFRLIPLCFMLTACGGSGGSDSSPAFAPNPDQPAIQQPPPNPGNQQPVQQTQDVTYYSKSLTEAPVAGWPTHTYTATGNCAQVNSKTYCWDDGVKTLPTWSFNSNFFGGGTYSYFSVMVNPIGGGPLNCHGGCGTDFVSSATVVDQSLNGVIGVTVTDVLTHGGPSTVTCNVIGNDLDCGSFALVGVQ